MSTYGIEITLKEKLQKGFKEGVDEAMNLVFKEYGLFGIIELFLIVMKFKKKVEDKKCVNIVKTKWKVNL